MYTRRDPPERRWHALCSPAGPYMSLRSRAPRLVLASRFLFAFAFAFLAAFFVASPAAHAQTTVAVAITAKDSLPRLNGGGTGITKRTDLASREGINLQDCHDDQSIQFPLTVLGFAPGDTAEIWASNGGAVCSDPMFRQGTTATSAIHCTKIGTFALVATTTATLKVKTILSATDVTTLDPSGCPIVDIETITVYFLILRGGGSTAAVGSDNVAIKIDTQGPLPLSNVRALPGDGALTISWDSVGEAGAQDIIGAQAFCDPAPAPSGATDAGSSQVCTEASTDSSTDADADPDAAAASAPEPTCSTVPNEGGAAGGPIPAASGIPSEGVACKTAAFTTGKAIPCGGVTGTTGNTIRVDSIAGAPLTNGVVYAIAVGGTDSFANVGDLSSPTCQFPETTSDFWKDYRAAGGQSGGCAVEGPAVPMGSFSLLMLGIVVTLSTLRRARRSARKASHASHASPPHARGLRRNDR
jgi:hypothetical protein